MTESTSEDGEKSVTLDTTLTHPFYVVGYGFKYASELKIGDKLRSVSGDIYEVSATETEHFDNPVKVYNFEVDEWHTYAVSEEGIVVHNANSSAYGNKTEDEKKKTSTKVDKKTTTTQPEAGQPQTSSQPLNRGNTEVILCKKPHKNGTKGHWETIFSKVDELKQTGNYLKIYVNKGLSNIMPGAKPNRRPYIMGVTNDGIVDQFEIPSKTDTPEKLVERMLDNQNILGNGSGKIEIIPIGDD